MAEHRVDYLRLHLHAAPGPRVQLQRKAERFVAEILEAVGDRLESNWPGRLFFLKSLELRWRIADAELSDTSAVSRYAGEIAESFGDPEPQRPGEPMPEGDIAVFRGEASWWACYLAALAGGNGKADAWYYESLSSKGIGLGSLADRGGEFAGAVLSALAEAGVLVPVARMGAPESLAALRSVLGSAATPIGRPSDPTLFQYARSLSRDLPDSTLWLILYAEALRLAGRPGARDEAARMTDSVMAEVASQETRSLEVPPEREPILEADTLDIRFGGLFYLFALALELDIGETLWKACLPEGAVLAHAAAALLGAAGEGDPAALLFGGVPELPPLEVSREQQEEVAAALAGSLAATLPRRSLARLPEMMFRILPLAGTPTLVGSEVGNAFPLFVWPGADPRNLERGIKAFLAAWPASAPTVLGTPAIAELEGGVRIRMEQGIGRMDDLFTAEISSPLTSALISQIAGTLAQVFAARAGLDRAPAAALVERYFALPARVKLSPEVMTVILPMSRIEAALRLSGLDRDPGWIPWLARTVRFIYAEDGQEP